MNAPTPIARAWDWASGVSECETCGGSGQVDKTPLGRAYRDPPGYWDAPCPDCEEQGVSACEVCGFDVQIKGFDCIVCETVALIPRERLRSFDPGTIGHAFDAAVQARLKGGFA